MDGFLFNFSASYNGGGLKRLHEYAKGFNDRGGANFIINSKSIYLVDQYPHNKYHIVSPTLLGRVFFDCKYLEEIIKGINCVGIYYSYGIPIYKRIGSLNWLHISNILPMLHRQIDLTLIDHIKMHLLNQRIHRSYDNSDVISAESRYSLSLVNIPDRGKLFLSVNGSDDELKYLSENDKPCMYQNYAIIVGTYRYKHLEEALIVFDFINNTQGNTLKLKIVGDANNIPKSVLKSKYVEVIGVVNRLILVDLIRHSRVYISTTCIENSYNAASEGVFLAEESYISDIAPHRELLQGIDHEVLQIPGVCQRMLKVRREGLSGDNLKSWEIVINEMVNRVATHSF